MPTDVPSEKRYKTSQRLAIVEFLSKHGGESFAVDDVYDALKRDDEKVGRTTVYRTLEKLCKEQSCTKIDARAGKPAQYIYGVEDISNASSSAHDIRLYCMNCNKLIALNCHHFQDFEDHVLKKHGFSLVTGRSLIYGTCEACISTEELNSTKRKD